MARQELSIGHVDATATPVDLRAGLADGSYAAQVGGEPSAELLFYVGATAPTDPDDYRIAHRRRELRFPVGTGSRAVWVRTPDDAASVPVALWSLPQTVPNPPLGRPHHDVGMVATDLRGALAEGTYRAQVSQLDTGDDLLYYVGATASLDLDDFRRVVRWEFFNFCAGAGTVPTWVRTRNGTAAVLTIDGGD